jgi:deoxyribonuclease V
VNHEKSIKLQLDLARKVITSDSFDSLKMVCGVDVAYKNDMAFACAVVINKNLDLVESANAKLVTHPYVSGLFFQREAEPALVAIRSLKNNFDLLLVDGHGQLHPRRCGLACHLGLTLDKPAIGVAKTLLCGQLEGDSVILDGKITGTVIKTSKKIYVSVGHKISLESATKIVRDLIADKQWMPEPLRLADLFSKRQKSLSH